jgi:hypothetical protein
MLRRFLFVIAGVTVALGLVLCALHASGPGIRLLIGGFILLLALSFERWRYRAPAGDATETWQQTGEVFEDPQSGQVVQVEFQAESGARRYLARGKTAASDDGHDG